MEYRLVYSSNTKGRYFLPSFLFRLVVQCVHLVGLMKLKYECYGLKTPHKMGVRLSKQC